MDWDLQAILGKLWQKPNSLPAGWQQHTDPASGNPYFYCRSTGETTWDRPEWFDDTSIQQGPQIKSAVLVNHTLQGGLASNGMMQVRSMDWDLGSSPDSMGRTIAFNQLLERLRCAHEEVCMRNAVLESQVAHNGHLLGSKPEDPWLPINFLAPKDSPAPRSPPWGRGKGKRVATPRIFDLHATDALTRQQQSLGMSIDNLARQQEHLSQQIAKVLLESIAVAAPQASSRRSQEDRSSIASAQHARYLEADRTSSSMSKTDTDKVDRFKVDTGKSRVIADGLRSMAHGIGVEAAAYEAHHHANWRGCLRQILKGSLFNAFTSIVMLSYATLIAVETNMIAEDPDMDSPTIQTIHYMFTSYFCFEMLFRIVANGWKTFFGTEARWNRLDAVLLVVGLVEIITEIAMGSAKTATSAKAMRIVRIFRVIRTVRLIRSVRQFHDFQKMTYALMSSFRTLICSMALMTFVMFFFAVWLTQSAADKEMRERILDLELRYGDVMATIYTLFLSVSGGISWDACFMPLHEFSWLSSQIFVLYIVVVLFGVLNVVTSVFVESVIRSVQHHKELIVQDKEDNKNIAMGHVKEVFRQVDQDGSGQVSIDEMEFFLQDPDLRKYMDALDIEAEDTRLLFKLLDCDGSGVIGVEEFCDGCLRLKGDARSIDIHALSWRITNFLDRWGAFTGYVEESFDNLRKKMQ